MPRTRVQPGWVLREGVDEELGVLKAGKEAGCFLVRRREGDRFCLLVRKDYRKRSDREYSAPVRAGERGIRRETYTRGVVILESRQRRAVAKKTRYGKEVLQAGWAAREFEVLRRLWEAGVSVPFPVEQSGDRFLMQYVGTLDGAAPRLADARLGAQERDQIYERLRDELRVMTRVGMIHADLSAYNILVQHGRPWIIDVPQAVDLYEHPNASEILERDVRNICGFFKRDHRPLLAELIEVVSGHPS